MNALASTLFVSSSWLLLAFGAPVLAQCETTRIVASDNASFDRFGHAVAVSAGTVIVGAVNHDHGGTDGGGRIRLRALGRGVDRGRRAHCERLGRWGRLRGGGLRVG